MKIGVHCSSWVEGFVSQTPHTVIKEYNAQGFDKKTVVGFLYSEESDELRIPQYKLYFDKILMILSDYSTTAGVETDIVEKCKKFDFPGVELLATGHIEYVPVHMKIKRFEEFFIRVKKLYEKLQYAPLSQLTPFVPKPYYFDALLGLPRPHRTWLRDQIRSQCLDKIFLIYYWSSFASIEESGFVWPQGAEIKNKSSWERGFFTNNHVEYHGVDTWLSLIVPIEVYNQSAYSIVTETSTHNDYSFYTEKIVKPILAKRLFVCFSGVNYLKNLRALGFKTFDGIIDESYDQEVDHEIRFKKAFDQILYLCNQDQSSVLDCVKPIAEHNYNLFRSINWHADWADTIFSNFRF